MVQGNKQTNISTDTQTLKDRVWQSLISELSGWRGFSYQTLGHVALHPQPASHMGLVTLGRSTNTEYYSLLPKQSF